LSEECGLLALLPQMDVAKDGCFPHPEVAVNAWWKYSSETNYIGSSPSDSV